MSEQPCESSGPGVLGKVNRDLHASNKFSAKIILYQFRSARWIQREVERRVTIRNGEEEGVDFRSRRKDLGGERKRREGQECTMHCVHIVAYWGFQCTKIQPFQRALTHVKGQEASDYGG